MINKICDLIQNFSLSREEYITQLVSIVSEEQNTKRFIDKGVIFKNEADLLGGIGGFCADGHHIQINLKELDYEIRDMIAEIPDFEENGESTPIIKRLLESITILHELEHANQINIRNNGTDLEARLLQIENGNIETVESYEVAPSERLAELKSFNQIIEIAKRINVPQNVIRFLKERQKSNYIRGYEDLGEGLEFPTNRYKKIHNIQNNIPSSIDAFEEEIPDLEYRMRYGLPITEDEFAKVASGNIQLHISQTIKSNQSFGITLKKALKNALKTTSTDAVNEVANIETSKKVAKEGDKIR